MKLNKLTSTMLSIGQTLEIPITINPNAYTVKSGDTLYKIAQNYGTTVDEIKRINDLTSNILSIGEILKIPNQTNNTNTYTVKSGDTLYKIAQNNSTTVDEIKRINNLTSNILSIGQVLKIN